MKKRYSLFILIIVFGFISIGTTAYAIHDEWNCGNLTVKKRVHSFKVLEHCGEPVSKENIGHNGAHNSGATREEWVYGPDAGYYYVVYITAGVVEKVESFRHDD